MEKKVIAAEIKFTVLHGDEKEDKVIGAEEVPKLVFEIDFGKRLAELAAEVLGK